MDLPHHHQEHIQGRNLETSNFHHKQILTPNNTDLALQTKFRK